MEYVHEPVICIYLFPYFLFLPFLFDFLTFLVCLCGIGPPPSLLVWPALALGRVLRLPSRSPQLQHLCRFGPNDSLCRIILFVVRCLAASPFLLVTTVNVHDVVRCQLDCVSGTEFLLFAHASSSRWFSRSPSPGTATLTSLKFSLYFKFFSHSFT